MRQSGDIAVGGGGDGCTQDALVRIPNGDGPERHGAVDEHQLAWRRQAAPTGARKMRWPYFIAVTVERVGPLASGRAAAGNNVECAGAPRAFDVLACLVPFRWDVALIRRLVFHQLLSQPGVGHRLRWRVRLLSAKEVSERHGAI